MFARERDDFEFDSTKAWISRILMGLGSVAGLLLLAAILFPLFVGDHRARRSTMALSNLKQVAFAQSMYLQDFDDRFVPVDRWGDAVLPYARNRDLFHTQLEDKRWISATMNGLLDGASLPVQEQEAAKLVMLFESLGKTWNGWGGPSGAWEGHDKPGRVAIAYTDSHARLLPRDKLFRLKWRP